MANWKLGRRQASCTACEREFDEGEVHFSRLESSAEELARIDVCTACWPAHAEQLPEQAVWWRARRQVSGKRGFSIDPESLMQVFQQLESATAERLLELRYVLSLLLMRKRRLFLTRALRRADAEFLVLRRPRHTQEQILVQVFELAPERMEGLRAELEQLFEGGLEELGGADGKSAETGESGPESESKETAAAADESETERPVAVEGDAAAE